MKKLLSAAAAVLALAMAFTGCNQGPETVVHQKATIILTDNIKIDTNLTYGTTDFANYQVNLDEFGKIKFVKDDVVKVTLKAKSDYPVKCIQANFVDTTPEANYWTVINNPTDVVIGGEAEEDDAEIPVEAITEFEAESEFTIGTNATAAGAAKLVIYVSPKSAGFETAAECGASGPKAINLSEVTLTIEINGGSDEAPVVLDPIVLFDPATAEAPEGMEIVEVEGEKYLKVTPNGYDTSFSIGSAVDVSEYSKVEVVAFTPETEGGFQFTVQPVDWSGSAGDKIPVTFSPAPTAPTTLTAAVPAGAKKVSHIQVMAQSTADWTALSDKAVYVGKITVK